MIPILTPSYFNSPACRNELEAFLNLERRSGRQDRILPLYFAADPGTANHAMEHTSGLARASASTGTAVVAFGSRAPSRFDPRLLGERNAAEHAAVLERFGFDADAGQARAARDDGSLGARPAPDHNPVSRMPVRAYVEQANGQQQAQRSWTATTRFLGTADILAELKSGETPVRGTGQTGSIRAVTSDRPNASGRRSLTSLPTPPS